VSRSVGGDELIRLAVARLRAGMLAISFGLVGGSLLAVATIWLLIRGGENVGQHLNLLGNFFLGYSVSWIGVPIGFLWAGLACGLIGWVVGWIYNWMAGRRDTFSG